MKSNIRKIGSAAIIFLLIVVYFAASFLVAKNTPPDSDYGNLMLESQEILHGNFFRNGWILTGISFLLTDLPYFMIGILAAGFGVAGYTVAIALMQTAVVAVGILLLFCGRDNISWTALLMYFSILFVPSVFWMSMARAHTGSVTLCLLALFLISSEGMKHRYLRYMAVVLLIATATSGDMVSAIVVSLPVVAVSVWLFLSSFVRLGTLDKSNLEKAMFVSCGIVIGLLADKLYFAMPGAALKNGFLGSQTFTSLNLIGTKLTDIFRALFLMYNCGFEGTPVVTFSSPIYLLRVLILFSGLICVVIVCFRLLTGKETDYISSVLSVGFILLLVILVMTSVYTGLGASRYFGYAPVCLSIISIRMIWQAVSKKEMVHLKRVLVFFSLACSILFFVDDIVQVPANCYIETPQDKLIRVLNQEGLTSGYADFWNASVITLKSNDSIHSRAIIRFGGAVAPYNWFCKEEWYHQYADFVILQEDNTFGLNDEALSSQFGLPQREISFDNYRILIYNHDISGFLALE